MLYTDFKDMIVLSSTVATRYYNCYTDASSSPGNYGFPLVYNVEYSDDRLIVNFRGLGRKFRYPNHCSVPQYIRIGVASVDIGNKHVSQNNLWHAPPTAHWFLTRLIFDFQDGYVPPKRLFIYGPHSAISQRIALSLSYVKTTSDRRVQQTW
jgi:hypothetical protein